MYPNAHGDIVVLRRGDEVMAQLAEYAKSRQLASAWLNALGGSGTLTLGFFNHDEKEYEWHAYYDPMEIVNLTGNLSWIDSEPFWHVHGTFGARDMLTVGGHVKELIVGLTCELLITPLEAPLTRVYDDETGLKLLSSGA